MRSISTYIGLLRRKGFRTCLYNLVTLLCAPSLRHSRKLYKDYKELILSPLFNTNTPLQMAENAPVWVCWLQGMENAPRLVQVCYASVQKYCADRPIHLITSENMGDYVTLPDYVMQKYRAGIIPPAQFSDILRLALLVRYGGIWIDSTVLLTAPLPQYITHSSFFFYQNKSWGDVPLPIIGSNWLLSGSKGHPVWQRLLDLLYAYWKREDTMMDYFIFHLFLYLLVMHNPQAEALLESMEFHCNQAHFVMWSRDFGKPYSPELWDVLLRTGSVHKLTYKYTPTPDAHNTIYDHMLNLSIEDCSSI